jgi:hypothetical protein
MTEHDHAIGCMVEDVDSKKLGGMGFRDLHTFNMAMLAKQSWRLLSKTESLCARNLKAKYYPNTSLLNAGPKQGSSYTWQSILAGLKTFNRGYKY